MVSSSVQTNIRELQTLQSQTRFWRWGVTLILLVMVVGCLITLQRAITGLTNDGPTKDAFVKELGARMQKSAIPAVEQMGVQALHEVDFAGEAKKLNRRTPELARAALQQLTLLKQELPTRGQKVLNSTFGTAIKQRESKIRAMFPEATDAQVSSLVTNLTTEAQGQAADISESLFAPHKQALDSIMSDFNTIQNSEAANVKGQQPTWDMALLIFDLARTDLQSLEPEASASAKQGNRPKGATK